jgi:putative transposase
MYTYKFRIYPNKETISLLKEWFGCSRYVWNWGLEKKTKYYKETEKSLSYPQLSKELTFLKKEQSWLKKVPSQALQQVLKQLETAFAKFFVKKSGYPKFKSKKNSAQSLQIPQGFKIEDNKLYLPKLRKTSIKIKKHRKIKGNIKRIVISMNKIEQFFVSIVTDYTPQKLPKSNKKIGIDLGLKHFLITGDGRKIPLPKWFKKTEILIKKVQRRLSKKQKGSKRYEKARQRLAKLQLKIANQRLDFLHKLSKWLIDESQVIAIESLNIKGMIRNHKLSKYIANASWGKFLEILKYKAKWYGREIISVDRFAPTSKMCNKCGFIKQDLKLSDRSWICPKCGANLDRDINAAQNILALATAGTVESYARGGSTGGVNHSD